jgi:hypothetical protein
LEKAQLCLDVIKLVRHQHQRVTSKKRTNENEHQFSSTAPISTTHKQSVLQENHNENSTMIIHQTGFNPQKSVRFLEIDTNLLKELRKTEDRLSQLKREESKKALTARPLKEQQRYGNTIPTEENEVTYPPSKVVLPHSASNRSLGRDDGNKPTDDARIESVSLTTVNTTRHSELQRPSDPSQFKLNPNLIKCSSKVEIKKQKSSKSPRHNGD